jgi:phosphoenolpyruvate-protein kinase (PTS system EI component)
MALNENNDREARADDQVAVAAELTPRLVLEQYVLRRKAIVVEQGSAGSPAAALCQSLRIPAIAGIYRAPDLFAAGPRVLVNGFSGQLVILPTGILKRKPAHGEYPFAATCQCPGSIAQLQETHAA